MSGKTAYHLDVVEPDGDKKRIDFGAAGTALVSNGPSALPSFSAPSASVESIEDDTEFFNATDNTKKFLLSAASVSTGTTRTYTWPDSSGTPLVVDSGNLVRPTSAVDFAANSVGIVDGADNTKRAVFAASGITTATTRNFTFPDADGTLALTSDIGGGVFLDSDFTVQKNGDTTAQWQVDATNITTATTRTTTLPDADGELYNNPNTEGIFVSKSSTLGNQTISDSTWTNLTFDTVDTDTYDDGSNFSSNTTYTCPATGYYAVSACYQMSGDVDGTKRIALLAGGVRWHGNRWVTGQDFNQSTAGSISIPAMKLSASDTIQVQCWHNSGNNLETVHTGQATWFCVRYLGPAPA